MACKQREHRIVECHQRVRRSASNRVASATVTGTLVTPLRMVVRVPKASVTWLSSLKTCATYGQVL